MRRLLKPRFLVPTGIAIVVVIFFALRTTSYERFEKVTLGEQIDTVRKKIDAPFERHDAGEFVDYLFWVRGRPGHPRLFGVDFPAARIIRVKQGLVTAKGRYEDFYDPHATLWSPKK
jgi:hypothetical protein